MGQQAPVFNNSGSTTTVREDKKDKIVFHREYNIKNFGCYGNRRGKSQEEQQDDTSVAAQVSAELRKSHKR